LDHLRLVLSQVQTHEVLSIPLIDKDEHVGEFIALMPGMPKLANAHPQKRPSPTETRPQEIIDDLIAVHALDEATMCLQHWIKRILPPPIAKRKRIVKAPPAPAVLRSRLQRRTISRKLRDRDKPRYYQQERDYILVYNNDGDDEFTYDPATLTTRQTKRLHRDSLALSPTSVDTATGPVLSEVVTAPGPELSDLTSSSDPEHPSDADLPPSAVPPPMVAELPPCSGVSPPTVDGNPSSTAPTSWATSSGVNRPPTEAESNYLGLLREMFTCNADLFAPEAKSSPALRSLNAIFLQCDDATLVPQIPVLVEQMKILFPPAPLLNHYDASDDYYTPHSDMHCPGAIILPNSNIAIPNILLDSGALHGNYMSLDFFEANSDVLLPLARRSTQGVMLGNSTTRCDIFFEVTLTLSCTDANGDAYLGRGDFFVFESKQDLIVGLPLLRATDLGLLQVFMLAECRRKHREALAPRNDAKCQPTLSPLLLDYRNEDGLLEFGSAGLLDGSGFNTPCPWSWHERQELSAIADNLELLQPWDSFHKPAPEEMDDDLPCSFSHALHFMEKSVEEARQEFIRQIPTHVSQAFRDNTDVVNLLLTKGMPVFVPQNWHGISGLPLLNLTFLEGLPSYMKPPARRVNPLLWVNAKIEFDRLQTYFYVPSNSPIASCLVIAPKSTPPFLRMCGDYVRLNKFIKMGHFPIPHVQQELAKLQKFKIFLDLDWCNSFHQIKLHPDTSEKLSIVTPWGQVKPLFMPEGIGPASAELQRVVAEIFADFSDWTVAIFDNLLVLCEDWDDAYRKLELILDRCKERNLFLKFSKTFLGYPEVNFFGYECKENSYGLSADRRDQIDKIPFPTSCTAAASFLGASLFFHNHLPNYSALTAHLYTMTSKKFNWDRSTWEHPYEEDFKALKAAIGKSFELFYPNYELEWILRTDASATGVGAVLLQRLEDGTLQPITFISEKFSDAATRWSTIKQEAYAIKWAVDKLSYYLYCKNFIIETDHQNLIWIEQSTVPIIQRWRILLQSFNFLLRHIPGKLNVTADWLSRLFSLDEATGLRCATRPTEDTDGQLLMLARLFRLNEPEQLRALHCTDSPLQNEDLFSQGYGVHATTLYHLATAFDADATDALHVLTTEAGEIPTPRSADSMFKKIHDGRMGHHGAKRSLDLLNKYFPGHGINFKTIEELVRTCPICQKHRLGATAGEVKEIVKSLLPEHQRSMLGVDIVKVAPDKHGNQYCIVPVNLLTKHCEIYPVKDKSALTLANAIFDYVTTYGLFDELRSDPGSDLTSEVVAQLNKWIGIRHTFTLVDRPQASGVERTNGKLLDMLRALVMEERLKDHWSEPSVLGIIKFILNSTPNSETGSIPLHATFGDPAKTYLKLPEGLSPTAKVHEYVRLLNDNLLLINKVTKQRQKDIHKKRTADTPAATQNVYSKDDLILKFIDHPTDKLTPRWSGPFLVTNQVKNVVWARNLISDAILPFQVAQVKRFVGDMMTAKKMAQLDHDQYVVDRISAYRGDPDVRTTMQFLVHFADKSSSWVNYSKDIFDTIAYEDYCHSIPQLRQLKYSHLGAIEYRAKFKKSVITTVKPGDSVYVDLRSWGAFWYSKLALPDRDTTNYYALCTYGNFANKSQTRIKSFYPVLGESYTVDNLFVVDYGSRFSTSAPDVLVDETFMATYGDLFKDLKRTNELSHLNSLLPAGRPKILTTNNRVDSRYPTRDDEQDFSPMPSSFDDLASSLGDLLNNKI